MNTDRELLEAAAKAAGIVGEYYCGALNEEWVDGIVYIRKDFCQCVWNPITDDGDALRLAVKVGIIVAPPAYNGGWEATASAKADETSWKDETSGSHEEATRRAIVRAAAEIGRSMT